jgi:hypothetical protein
MEKVKTMRGSGREFAVTALESDAESALKSARGSREASEEIIGMLEL